ncbi:tuzin [Novymonas esmeraldas]|uniref:Tuzin n=1 Tax=Novymonas esmeraldas TaxID=1808958 RepID=A0AAW0EUM3_9TRYP
MLWCARRLHRHALGGATRHLRHAAAGTAAANVAAEPGPVSAPAPPPPLLPSSPSSSTTTTGFIPGDLSSFTARAYFTHPLIGLGVHHFAVGRIKAQLARDEYVVDMEEVHLSPMAEVSARVYVRVGRTTTNAGRVVGGIVGRVNSNGTLGVLLDNNSFEAQVSQDDVVLVEGRSRFTLEKGYFDMVEWIRDAGVHRRADRERLCSLLYQRGWRVDKLYLLEPGDVHCMSYVKKSVRMVVLEKAEWQRDHHAEMRTLLRERVKERTWRYVVQKYSGFVSANWAGLGVMSVFLWNFKNYRRQQRSFQVKHAVNTLTHTDHKYSSSLAEPQQFVERAAEESWARQVLRQLDITHPRIAVLTGFRGCGKSSLLRSAVRKEHKPALFVEVRGSEDTLSCIVKAMKVPNLESCGDYLEFITDTFTKATKINGEPPILVVTLREGSELSRVYNESVVLACDRRLCHLVYEVALESLTIHNVLLPRLDFYSVPNFNVRQAFQYTEHTVDAMSMLHFIEVIGTNSNDIDELLAAVLHRKVSMVEYTDQKLLKAMRQVEAAWGGSEALRTAVKKLSEAEYYVGQQSGTNVLRDPALKEIVLYDPVRDRWVFTHKVYHTAARCCL